MASPRLSVLVPVFNEAGTVRALLERVMAVPIPKEIIVVDDCSQDGTRAVLEDLRATLPADPDNACKFLFHEVNQGKGAAVRTAAEHVTGDIALIQDADLEYDPAEYPRLIQPILEGHADVVFGSRFSGSPRRVLFFWHTVANKLLTLFSNMVTNLNLTDMETGYKVFRADIIKSIPIRSSRFGVEPELTAKLAKVHARIYEVPISYAGRAYWEGKKIRWTDGVVALWTILRYAFVDDQENADPGYKTLLRLSRAERYNRWMLEQLAPWLGQRVLEIGSGIGSFTRYLVGRDLVVATDVNPRYLRILGNTFDRHTRVDVEPLDLMTFDPAPLAERRLDTILCLNVLEHVEDDQGALRRLHAALAPGGRLLLLVPAHPRLYGAIDRAIDHHRRYETKGLVAKLEEAGFRVEHTQFFNRLGVLGWYLNSVLLRRTKVPAFQLHLQNMLVPFLRAEAALPLPFGLSLIAVARRT